MHVIVAGPPAEDHLDDDLVPGCGMADAMLFALAAVVGLALTPARGLAVALWRARRDPDALRWLVR